MTSEEGKLNSEYFEKRKNTLIKDRDSFETTQQMYDSMLEGNFVIHNKFLYLTKIEMDENGKNHVYGMCLKYLEPKWVLQGSSPDTLQMINK